MLANYIETALGIILLLMIITAVFSYSVFYMLSRTYIPGDMDEVVLPSLPVDIEDALRARPATKYGDYLVRRSALESYASLKEKFHRTDNERQRLAHLNSELEEEVEQLQDELSILKAQMAGAANAKSPTTKRL